MTWSDIAAIFETLERRLIASLKRNLQLHRDWEKREGFNWSAWQAEKLKNAEAYRRQNKRIMDEYTDQIDAETRLLMEEQFREGYEHEEQVIAETGFPANPTMRSFFGVNARRVGSLIDDMLHIEEKAESAALRMMDDVYRTTVAKAAAEMAVGSVTFQQAADNATRELLRTGINCIEYADGRRVNIADYVQMALRTAAIRSYLQGEAKKREELGIDTVLVSQYGACSETCLPWQGDVYIDDVYGSFFGEIVERSGGEKRPDKTLKFGKSRNGNWYPLLSEAVHDGLFHPNCRHTLSTWIEGVSRRPAPLDKDKVKETAKLEQEQRKMERKIRESKRMVAGLSDPEMQKQTRRELRKRQKELKTFVDEHSDVLRRDYWKEKVYPEERAALNETLVKKLKSSTIKTGNRVVQTALDSGEVLLKVNPAKQKRHLKESDGYIEGRSYIYGDLDTAQSLISSLSGTGSPIMKRNGEWTKKERVTHSNIIGVHIDNITQREQETSKATIIYSKTGTHIMPRKDEENES